MNNERRILVVDGNPLVYRTDAVEDLTAPDGRRVSGVYGALSILQGVVGALSPARVFIVWDWKRSELWRRFMYSDYKANREPKTREEVEKRQSIYQQIALLYEILQSFPVQQFWFQGMEGDDLAYWITRRMLPTENPKFVCVTVDRDWLQLVDHTCSVYFSDSQTLVDIAGFQKEAHYLNVEEFLLAKSLIGDTSDNVKGVPGIGPKAVEKLLPTCATLEEMACENKKIDERLSDAYFSRMLTDLSLFPYTSDLDRYLRQVEQPKTDWDRVRKQFETLHFVDFLSRWKVWTAPSPPTEAAQQ